MSSHSPEEATSVVSGVKLDKWEELGFGMRRPKHASPFVSVSTLKAGPEVS